MIFIVGYSRSGTKLINQILDKLEIADSVPEVHFFEQVYEFGSPESERNKILTLDEAVSGCDRLLGITARTGSHLDNGRAVADINEAMTRYVKNETGLTLLDIYKRLLGELSTKAPIDPTPRNAFYIREIAELLPEAKFIYMVRDPRDCILSQKNKWKTYWREKKRPAEAARLWLNYNPLLMSTFWKNSLASHRSASSGPIADRLLTINYESLIKNPDDIARILQTFTGHGIDSFDSSFINRSNSGKWVSALSPAEIYLIQRTTGSALVDHGYKPMPVPVTVRLQGNLLALYYFAKIPIAFLANLHRVNNPLRTIRRRLFRVG